MRQGNCNLKTDKPRGKRNLLNKLKNAQTNRKNTNMEIHVIKEENKNCVI